MVFYSLEQNIKASLRLSYSGSDYDDAEKQMNYALAVAMICFVIQYVGLFFGFSMFFHRVNAFHITMNFVGFVTLLFFTLENWRYEYYWTIVGFYNICPAILETFVILGVPVFKGLQ